MQTYKNRRRTNGTVDIDRCRQEALTRRAQTRTQFFGLLGRCLGMVIFVAYILPCT